jgi:hypothetical protein
MKWRVCGLGFGWMMGPWWLTVEFLCVVNGCLVLLPSQEAVFVRVLKAETGRLQELLNDGINT